MEPRRRDTRCGRPEPHAARAAAARSSSAPTGGACRRARSPRARPQNERAPAARLEEAVGLARAIDLDVVQSGIVPLNQIRPATYIGNGKVDEIAGPGEKPRGRHRDGRLRALAGAAAQSGEGVGRQGARPHRADPGNFRPPRAHQGGRAAGRARASDLSAQPAGAELDPSGAPARRLRLPRRPGRKPARNRPPPDRRAHRAHRGRARKGQEPPQAASRQPRARAVSDRGAGRLHQCRQIDAVQPHDAAPACCRPTCCSRRSIRRCARCNCRAA